MKKLIAVLVIGLFLSFESIAHATIASPQVEAKKEAATSPELAEASRLSAEVIKLYNEKKYDEALPSAKRVIEIREKALGPDHEALASALYNLAAIYQAKEKYGEAKPLYNRALRILEKNFGPDSLRLTNTIDNLAVVSFALNDRDRAEELLKRSLAIREKALGPTHQQTAFSLDRLGQLYDRMGKYAIAFEHYKRALEIKEKALGPKHPQLADLLQKCACALVMSDRADEATAYQQRADEIRDTEPPPVRKGGGVLAGEAIERHHPEYPLAAKGQRVSGPVIVEVTVSECGSVISARALIGHSLLRPASIDAARRWRFKPTLLEGRPVKVIGTITFNFNL